MAAVLLYTRGLNALRTASLTMGLPMAIFIIIASVGLVRALRVDYASHGVPSAQTLRKRKVPPRKSLDVDRPEEEEMKRKHDK